MTISQLVAETGAQMRVFDLGRKIKKIGRSDFEAFEQLAKPYPSPYLRHAWVGILTWRPSEPDKHSIWFLKLPLDEQNILQPGPRDAFLQHWLKVARYPDKEHGEAPCSFKPDSHRMAYFHAKALDILQQAPTSYYSTTRAYLSGDNDWAQWQHLGIQGIAEVVARVEQDHNNQLLVRALSKMPATPRNIFFSFLENIELDHELTQVICQLLDECIDQSPSEADLAAFSRALSSSVSQSYRQQALQKILEQPQAQGLEVLSAISSRYWQDLDGTLMQSFLERLAIAGSDVFMALVADLMTISGQREKIMQAFRHPSRSDHLSSAIGAFMAMARGHTQ